MYALDGFPRSVCVGLGQQDREPFLALLWLVGLQEVRCLPQTLSVGAVMGTVTSQSVSRQPGIRMGMHTALLSCCEGTMGALLF